MQNFHFTTQNLRDDLCTCSVCCIIRCGFIAKRNFKYNFLQKNQNRINFILPEQTRYFSYITQEKKTTGKIFLFLNERNNYQQ